VDSNLFPNIGSRDDALSSPGQAQAGQLAEALSILPVAAVYSSPLQRASQLYSRIGFVHEIEPLSEEETRFFLAQRWSHCVSAHSADFTDQEAVAAIMRIIQGNMRLIDRLMRQVERVLLANQLTVVTKEVVETARQNLIIGFN
jgi:DNA transposition AAA+ family ATPase